MTQDPLVVYKGRTNVFEVKLPYDVSEDVLKSQIRVGADSDTPLIAEWVIEFKSDGKDGSILIVLDDSAASVIGHTFGYTDIKRITDGEPVPVFDNPLPVFFCDEVSVLKDCGYICIFRW